MNFKKLLSMLFVSLVAFSLVLTSCEKKNSDSASIKPSSTPSTTPSITPSETQSEADNELVDFVMDKTSKKLEEAASKSYLGINANAAIKGKFDLATIKTLVEEIDGYDGTITNTNKAEIDTTLEMQANLDADGIRKTPNADITNTESYMATTSSLNASTSFNVNIEGAPELSQNESQKESTNTEAKMYQKGVNVVNYTKNEETELTVGSVLSVDQVNSMATEIVSILDTLSGKTPIMNDSFPIDEESLTIVQTKTVDFFSGKITAEEYATILDTTFTDGQLFEVFPKEAAVGLLEVAYEVNPSKYFEYTTVIKMNGVTLNTSFKYDNWKIDFITKLNDKISSMVKASQAYVVFAEIKSLVTFALPESMKLDLSLSINNEGYINGMTFDIATKGVISAPLVELLIGEKNTIMTYDIAFSGSFNYELSDKTKVTTLQLPSSN